MQPSPKIVALAQSVYLRIKNRQYDDITSDDGLSYIANIIDFGNGFLDELETSVNPDGSPLDWKWSYLLNATIGTATAGSATVSFPATYLNLIADPDRYVQIQQDGTPVAWFKVVAPGDITNKRYATPEDRVTYTGNGLLTFSRVLKDTEAGGTIIGDVTTPIPRLSTTNSKAVDLIRPRELLVLGIAKNASLPDIVKGALSPSYVQKYNDLFNSAVMRNMSTSVSRTQERDNLGYISGVGF